MINLVYVDSIEQMEENLSTNKLFLVSLNFSKRPVLYRGYSGIYQLIQYKFIGAG